jgi:hypothetical protein
MLSPTRVICFAVPVVLIGAAILGTYRRTIQRGEPAILNESTQAKQLPASLLMGTPIVVHPRGDLTDVIPQSEVRIALQCWEPYWEYRRAGDILHALRLWGPNAQFPERPVFAVPAGVVALSGNDMLRFFLDDHEFRRRYPTSLPYFFPSRQGWGARVESTGEYNAHVDDFLELAAECSLPVDTRLNWSGKSFTIRDLFEHSFQWYHPKRELEFTAVAYAHYLDPKAYWVNRFGDRFTLNDLSLQLLELDLNERTCFGTHVPYALTMILYADELHSRLSQPIKHRIEERLRSISARLTETQTAAGWWNASWTGRSSDKENNEDEMFQWLTCTGHHLEWITLVRPELRPPKPVICRAAQRLLYFLRNFKGKVLSAFKQYAPISHVARALVLLSGKRYASELMDELWTQRNRAAARK